MKKVALVLLPVFWPKMPPLGISFLQAYAFSQGFSVDCLDLNNLFYSCADNFLKKEWLLSCNFVLEDSILDVLKKKHSNEFEAVIEKLCDYDLLGFSCFKSNWGTTQRVIQILKNRKPGIKIILGGPEVARQYFKTNGSFEDEWMRLVDHIVVGQGENPFVNILSGVQNRMWQFEELGAEGSQFFPRYHGMNLAQYPRQKSISILSSKGCIRRCTFCSERLLYKKFQARSAGSVLDELRFHRDENNVSNFIFHDSMLNADLRNLESLCDGIIKKFGSVAWEAQIGVRPDMEEELFEKMKKSGCYHVFIGLESGCDATLSKMKKGFTAQEAEDFFAKLKDAGLSFGVSMIVGFPGETDEDFQESLNFIIKNKEVIRKIEQVNPFVYYDGTEVSCDNVVPEAECLRRMEVFISALKSHGIKYTNAFVGNLVGK